MLARRRDRANSSHLGRVAYQNKPEQLTHIFKRFYRVDKSRSRTFGGSGIGLTIAQSLAQAMGGEIRVESAGLGQGSSLPSHSLRLTRDMPFKRIFLIKS
jgi:signal transduction histidine kinase